MTTLPDKAAIARLLDAWRVVQADLMRDAQYLADLIAAARAAGQDVTEAWLLRQDRYHALLAQVQAQVDRYAQLVGQVVTIGQAAAVMQALTVSGEQIAAGLVRAGVSVDVNRLPVTAVADLVGRLSDGAPLGVLLQTFGPQARTAASEALVSGLGRGIGPRSIAPAVREALDVAPVRALVIARQEIVGSYRNASLRQYAENSDVLSGWVWTAARSPRTCAMCWAMHGTVHDLDEPFASHVCCRCAPRPLVKGIDVELTPGHELFDALESDVQKQILGPAKYASYAAGQFTLPDLVAHTRSQQWGPGRRERSLKEVLAG